jgi:hypothetical protein
MTKSLRIVQMAFVLLLTIPGLARAAQALIVHDTAGGGGIDTDTLNNLTTHLTGKGFTVITSTGLPGSLAGNQQVWDIRYNNSDPLTASDITAYTAYLAAGGSLVLIGENAGFFQRNNTLVAMVAAAGGGPMVLTSPQDFLGETVLAPFTGPTPLATMTFLASDGVRPPARAHAIARDLNNIASAVLFGPGMLSGAPAGSLILVFDVNFLQAGADANSQIFIDNLISYQAAPVVVQGNMFAGPPDDLDGDGRMDLVWRETQTGDMVAWLMNGAVASQQSFVAFGQPWPTGVPVAWQIAGIGDVNGDTRADLIWYQTQTGEVAVSLMSGTSVTQTLLVSLGMPLAWQIVGVGDVNGDQKADLVWRNTQTGDVVVWLMNGATVTQTAVVAAGVPLAWQIAGVADVNGDTEADLIWRNTQTGDVAVWLMNGTMVTQTALVGPSVPLAWQITGVGDLNGDGKADLVWRNTQTGDVAVWLMNGAVVSHTAIVASGVPLSWQIVEVGDLNHDGNADLVWRDTQAGDVAAWFMNGAAVTSTAIVASGVPLAWQIQ